MKTLNLQVCKWLTNQDIMDVGTVFTTSASSEWNWCCIRQSTERPEELRPITVEVEDRPVNERQPDDASKSSNGGDYHETLWEVLAVQ